MTPQRMTVKHRTMGGHKHVGVWLGPASTPEGALPKVGDLVLGLDQWPVFVEGVLRPSRSRYVDVTVIEVHPEPARDDMGAAPADEPEPDAVEG